MQSPMIGSAIGAPSATAIALSITPALTIASLRAWLPSAISAHGPAASGSDAPGSGCRRPFDDGPTGAAREWSIVAALIVVGLLAAAPTSADAPSAVTEFSAGTFQTWAHSSATGQPDGITVGPVFHVMPPDGRSPRTTRKPARWRETPFQGGRRSMAWPQSHPHIRELSVTTLDLRVLP